MRKIYAVLLALLLAAVLCSCSSARKAGVYSVEKEGITFTVDTEENTVSDGTNTYHYVISGRSPEYSITITYPNGSTYFWTQKEFGGNHGWSDGYDAERYADGQLLCEVLEEEAPAQSSSRNLLLNLLLGGIGAWNLFSPGTAWYLEYGWRYKDAEPSEAALWANRAVGVLLLGLAVILFFV